MYLQVDDVPPYITVPPYTTTVWGVSAPEAFYPKNSVAQQADVSQPYGGGSPAMGGWFSAVCYTFGRRLYRHFDGTVPIGLVDASWGGKTIESFAPPTAMVRVRPATTKQYPSITRIPKYHPNNIAQSLTDHPQSPPERCVVRDGDRQREVRGRRRRADGVGRGDG